MIFGFVHEQPAYVNDIMKFGPCGLFKFESGMRGGHRA